MQGDKQGQTVRCHPDSMQADAVQSMRLRIQAGPILHPAHKAQVKILISIWTVPSMSNMPTGLTCGDDCSDEQACFGGHLVDALQSCLKAGMKVGKQHAVNPHISIQRGSEIPFYSTNKWSQYKQIESVQRNGVSTNK